ncbi:hypothetical protein, partial [Nocardia gipuzkoensis]|uniref:hypothetical protein n=1 Tax=Nocardia gipuzkoensis TaxID=2749991 RepID=UPI003CC7F741
MKLAHAGTDLLEGGAPGGVGGQAWVVAVVGAQQNMPRQAHLVEHAHRGAEAGVGGGGRGEGGGQVVDQAPAARRVFGLRRG